MKKKAKEDVPARAAICTVIGAVIVIAATVFSVYAGSSSCRIPNIEHPMWGLLVCGIYLFAGWLIKWGWNGKI